MTFDEYKQSLLTYLSQTQSYEERDIQEHQLLTDAEKIEQGYMIADATLLQREGNDKFRFATPVNNTKWRIGDKLQFVVSSPMGETKGECQVTDNFMDTLCVAGNMNIPKNASISFTQTETNLTQLFYNVVNQYEEYGYGAGYLKSLGGMQIPLAPSDDFIKPNTTRLSQLNEPQRKAVEDAVRMPSLYAIQGPPGTGKTKVLAEIAREYSEHGETVLIISHTHQAVNNALNAISESGLPIIKIGDELRAVDLQSTVVKYSSFNEYYRSSHRRQRKGEPGKILGVTLCSATIALALRQNVVAPTVILVDEASQIPLAYAAAIGKMLSPSVIFFGDDQQMPPIFHEQMKDDPLSVSIFAYLQNILPVTNKTVLTTTYRMNAAICHAVSSKFYEPKGITLHSDSSVARNCIYGEELYASMEYIDVATKGCTESNEKEAVLAVQRAINYVDKGYSVAIVTPYRKQVNSVREQWIRAGRLYDEIQIDTVERLQGQDVDVIILSFATSDINYYYEKEVFLLNANRLNVMISRAKRKVVVIKSPIISLNKKMPLLNNTTPTILNPISDGMYTIDGEPQIVRETRKRILSAFADLQFLDEGHIYLLNGKELQSVSTIAHRFESRPFDVDKQAFSFAKKHGHSADYWKMQWNCHSFCSTSIGTKTHEFGESLAYLFNGHPEMILDRIKPQFYATYNYLAPLHPKEEAIIHFLEELPPSFHLVLNETKVYSGKNPDMTKNLKEQICGTFDMLYYYDGDGDETSAGYVVMDYKTNADLYNAYSREKHIMLLPPFEDLYQESLGIYTIQLSLYALMLEDIGLHIIDRILIWLKDDGTYERISTKDLTNQLREVL